MASIATDLTDLLGIDYPIVSAAMGPGGQQQLVTAVSEAGGLGVISGPDASDPREARTALKQFFDYVTSNTDEKFGVNVTVGTNPNRDDIFERQEAIIEEILVSKVSDERVNEQLKLLETSAGSPGPFLEKIHDVKEDTDLVHFQKCANVHHAKKAVEEYEVDGITASGYEMAGHTHKPEDAAHTFVLLPAIAEAVDVPVIASGGVRNGHSLLGALCLGADGVYMGSRMIATEEADFDDAYKEYIIEAEPGDDMTIEGAFGPMRVLESPGVEQLRQAKKERDPAEVEMMKGRKIAKAMQGNIEQGLVVAGQVSGYIDDKPPVQKLFDDMVATAAETHDSMRFSE